MISEPINGFAIQHRTFLRLFLGRDGVRNIPLFFRNSVDAKAVLSECAQVPADWKLIHAALHAGSEVEA